MRVARLEREQAQFLSRDSLDMRYVTKELLEEKLKASQISMNLVNFIVKGAVLAVLGALALAALKAAAPHL